MVTPLVSLKGYLIRCLCDNYSLQRGIVPEVRQKNFFLCQ